MGEFGAFGNKLLFVEGENLKVATVDGITTLGEDGDFSQGEGSTDSHFFAQGGDFSSFWASDGTQSGTVVVRSEFSYWIGTTGNYAYFRVSEDSSPVVWRSDGTLDGTGPAPGVPEPEGFTTGLETWKNTLYFNTPNDASGLSRLRDDSVSAESVALLPAGWEVLRLGVRNEPGTSFRVLGDTLLFLAQNNQGETWLWSSAGVGTETALLRIEGQSLAAVVLGASDELLFFVAYGNQGTSYWKTDGTKNGTTRVFEGSCSFECPFWVEGLGLVDRDPSGQGTITFFDAKTGQPGVFGSKPTEGSIDEAALANDRLVYSLNSQLWYSERRSSEFDRLVELDPSTSHTPQLLAGDSLQQWFTLTPTFFDDPSAAVVGSVPPVGGVGSKIDLPAACRSGVSAGFVGIGEVVLFCDVGAFFFDTNSGVLLSALADVFPLGLAEEDGPLLFASPETSLLLSTRGKIASTKTLLAVGDLWASGLPGLLFSSDQGTGKTALIHSDGSVAGTAVLEEDLTLQDERLIGQSDNWVYVADTSCCGVTRYRADGSETVVLPQALPPGVSFSRTVSFGDSVVLLAHAFEGTAVWRLADTDTQATALGLVDVVSNLSAPVPSAVIGSKLLMRLEEGLVAVAQDGQVEVLARHRHRFEGLEIAGSADGGVAFFTLRTAAFGEELWVTDGTAAGTRLVHDIRPGPASSRPHSLRVSGDRLFFNASDGANGVQVWSLSVADEGCVEDSFALCLQNDRFRLEVSWSDFDGGRGRGRAERITADTGYFWFFDQDNIEVVAKVLDARVINDYFWMFFGALTNVEYSLTLTDSFTGKSRRYSNPAGNFASAGDTLALSPDLPGSLATTLPLTRAAAPASVERGTNVTDCVPSDTVLCLNRQRFEVSISWREFSGNTGEGKVRELTDDTGAFWFFEESNVETTVKVLDARALNSRFWVFYGSLTNVAFTLRIRDTETGVVRTYENPLGEFASVGDVDAFEP